MSDSHRTLAPSGGRRLNNYFEHLTCLSAWFDLSINISHILTPQCVFLVLLMFLTHWLIVQMQIIQVSQFIAIGMDQWYGSF